MTRIQLTAAAYLLLVKEDRILLLRRYNTGWNDGNYSVPAGHIESGETFSQAMVREAYEEIGIRIESKDLKVVHVMHRLPVSYIDIFFVAKDFQGDIQNKESEKCDDLRWFPLNETPANMVPSVKSAIDLYVKGETYSEFLIDG